MQVDPIAVADEFGIALEDVTVIHGDTSIVQYGIGTFGSRGIAVGGTAVYMAVEKLKEKAKQIAAHMLGAEHASVVFKEGKFSKEAAKAAAAGSSLPKSCFIKPWRSSMAKSF